MSAPPTRDEFLACVLAREIEGLDNVAVGTNSPVAATAALLVEAESGGGGPGREPRRRGAHPVNDGGSELHDRAAQGRIDAFFLGGGQIDGAGNINLVGTGEYPDVKVRFPGSYGSAFLYFLIPRVILFREEHSRRVLVPRVDFVSAPGTSPPSVHRSGGPHALVTRLCAMAFDRDEGGFRLQSLHPGVRLDAVRAATGFAFDTPAEVPETSPPEPGRLALIREIVRERVAETYPEFAATRIGPG